MCVFVPLCVCVCAAVNGLMFGNLRGLDVCVGDRVVWHTLGLGSEVDLHGVYFQGNVFRRGNNTRDTLNLFPHTSVTVAMTTHNIGKPYASGTHTHTHIHTPLDCLALGEGLLKPLTKTIWELFSTHTQSLYLSTCEYIHTHTHTGRDKIEIGTKIKPTPAVKHNTRAIQTGNNPSAGRSKVIQGHHNMISHSEPSVVDSRVCVSV